MTTAEKLKHAREMQELTAQAYELAKRLNSKYINQEIKYKSIGASRAALKANEERREATRELMGVLLLLLDKYKKQEYKCQVKRCQETRRKFMHFTVYPNGRR